ncbi:MAG: hypothetical protein MAG453_02060 [Calditrichaeota bacterium]|nr:hypothetical protein [Calditrichota bacterium]
MRMPSSLTIAASLAFLGAGAPVATGSNFGQPIIIGESFNGASWIAVADLDGDGLDDLAATATYGDEVRAWRSLGAGEFSSYLIDGDLDGASCVDAADIDGDGDLDLVACGLYGNEITWYERAGAAFTPHLASEQITGPSVLAAGDVNGDELPDIVVVSTGIGAVGWLENAGGGDAFVPHAFTPALDAPAHAILRDWEGDGDLDVLACEQSQGRVLLWRNDGPDGFPPAEPILDALPEPRFLDTGDFDGDLNLDIATGAGEQNVVLIENVEGISFEQHPVGGEPGAVSSLATRDIDGDGDLDILFTVPDENTIGWLSNEGEWSFAESVLTTSFHGATFAAFGNFNGDPVPEVASIELTPFDPPILIPPYGGSFFYDAVITSYSEQTQPLLARVSTVLPNGAEVLLESIPFALAPGGQIEVNWIEQEVPGFAPPGDYLYIATLVRPNLEVVHADSFAFSKSGFVARTGGEGWKLHGWSAPAGSDPDSPPAQSACVSEPHPNPFNSTSSVTIRLPQAGELTADVFDVTGRRVATLADGLYPAGRHTLTFDASALASGLYFIRASVPGRLDEVRKLALVR